jgi:hypothetical protein
MPWVNGKWVNDPALSVIQNARVRAETRNQPGTPATIPPPPTGTPPAPAAPAAPAPATTLSPGQQRLADLRAARDARVAARQTTTTTTALPPGVGPPAAAQVQPPPVLEDASVEKQLTGLLADNSLYMQAARKGGIRTAARRGLLNSTIAAGAGEAAAIAAAAPIASQQAAQIHAANQSRLDSWLSFNNATRLQAQQDAEAMRRQLASQASQEKIVGQQLAQDMTKLGMTIAAEKEIAASNQATQTAIATANNANALTQTQINANTNLVGNYLQGFASLASNPEVPATARDAYIKEMKAVVSQGMGITNELAGTKITWTPPATTPAAPTGAVPVAASGGTTSSSPLSKLVGAKVNAA